MQIIDNITLPAFAGARPTITRYHGVDYVYLLENTSTPVRYSVTNGIFTFDDVVDSRRRSRTAASRPAARSSS